MPAINNQMLRFARDTANRLGIVYLGEYNLGAYVAVPESHERGGGVLISRQNQ